MEELLKALREGDEEQINKLACELFSMHCGGINRAQINEFEHYAPCTIFTFDNTDRGTFCGGIKYHDRTFMFG